MVADKSIFAFDPILGCPFDDDEMKMVEEWRGFKTGMQAGFRKCSTVEFCGTVVAIGEGAKYFDGVPFVAFAIEVDGRTHFTTHKEVYHIL